MPTEHRHHISGSLSLAVGLAATAGFVDAFIYLRVTPVFVANMSGNLIRLGIATGGWNGRQVAAGVVALAGFLGGVFLATSHTDRRIRVGKSASPVGLLFVESILLGALPVIHHALGVTYSSSVDGTDYPFIIVGAAAMGVQAVALRRVGQVAVSTTYGTGAVVRLGEKLALAARRSDRPGDIRRRITVMVLSAVLAAYVGGAAVAAAVGGSPELLWAPAIVPLGAAVLLVVRGGGETVVEATAEHVIF